MLFSRPYIDTHCHLDSILERLETATFAAFQSQCLTPDFQGCLTVSCDPDAIDPTLALLENPQVFAAFGIHPHDSRLWDGELEQRLRQALKHEKCVAYGEIGLDYHYAHSPVETQKKIFALQMNLAIEAGKPLVIHTREADADTLALMRENLPRDWPIHVHCFTSSRQLAESLLSDFSRLYLGFTGIITFKNTEALAEIARMTPSNRLLLETDGPYLAPVPHRGKVAHPGHIPLIAQKLAECKGMELEGLYQAARENTRALFGI